MRRFQRLLSVLMLGAVLGAPAAALAVPVDPEPAGDPVVGFGSNVDPHEPETAAHGAGHVPHFEDINWFYGLIGESEDAEPSLLWRPKGMPAPFGAMLINTGLLFFVLVRFGRRPIAESLKKRKQAIMTGMDDAARMREEARARLSDYETKLAHIDEEIAQVRTSMRESGQAERARILAEAKEKHVRMERDARDLVEHELKAARDLLLRDTVRAALRSAEDRLRQQVTAADQQRLAEEYLAGLAGRVGGGRA